tara:strand:- start:17 stop:337 length:321 start_codon:yes stop_codon:yes gene_type:complete
LFGWFTFELKPPVPFDSATTGSLSYMDVRDQLPSIDPENLSSQDVLTILLHLFQQQPGFVDRGHEVNNKDTAWVNGFLFRLHNDAAAEQFSIEELGSSVDKISALR